VCDAASWATAVGTIALALAAGAAYRQNVRLVNVTRDAAIATRDAARAATKEAQATAELVEEARRDRELNWQPVLTIVQRVRAPGAYPEYSVKNTGRGPAYSTVVAWKRRGPSEITVSVASVAVGPGEEKVVIPSGNDLQAGGVLPDDASWAVYCEDQFRIRYRFGETGGRPDVWKPEQAEPQWLSVWRIAGVGRGK
jgi:hypothetical protein